MAYIPLPLLKEIIRLVGKQGFRALGRFIAAGPVFTELVYSQEVLVEVNLDEFIFNSHLANVESQYRPFLLKCLEHNNITAKFLESVRLLTQVGPSQDALVMLGETASECIYGHFAYAIFLICCGDLKAGLLETKKFMSKVEDITHAVVIANQVETMIRGMGLLGYRLFSDCFANYYTVVPPCWTEHNLTSIEGEVCRHCFAFTYAEKFRNMC